MPSPKTKPPASIAHPGAARPSPTSSCRFREIGCYTSGRMHPPVSRPERDAGARRQRSRRPTGAAYLGLAAAVLRCRRGLGRLRAGAASPPEPLGLPGPRCRHGGGWGVGVDRCAGACGGQRPRSTGHRGALRLGQLGAAGVRRGRRRWLDRGVERRGARRRTSSRGGGPRCRTRRTGTARLVVADGGGLRVGGRYVDRRPRPRGTAMDRGRSGRRPGHRRGSGRVHAPWSRQRAPQAGLCLRHARQCADRFRWPGPAPVGQHGGPLRGAAAANGATCPLDAPLLFGLLGLLGLLAVAEPPSTSRPSRKSGRRGRGDGVRVT